PGPGTGARPHGEVLRRLEGAVAVAPQHTHAVVPVVGRGDVEEAVAVELRHGHGHRLAPGIEGPQGEKTGHETVFEQFYLQRPQPPAETMGLMERRHAHPLTKRSKRATTSQPINMGHDDLRPSEYGKSSLRVFSGGLCRSGGQGSRRNAAAVLSSRWSEVGLYQARDQC